MGHPEQDAQSSPDPSDDCTIDADGCIGDPLYDGSHELMMAGTSVRYPSVTSHL